MEALKNVFNGTVSNCSVVPELQVHELFKKKAVGNPYFQSGNDGDST